MILDFWGREWNLVDRRVHGVGADGAGEEIVDAGG